MFATLASGYPRPPLPDDTSGDDLVRAVIEELEAAGLQILSDAGLRRSDPLGGIAARLQGFEIGDPVPYLGTDRTYRRPRAIHEPRWDGPIYLHEWEVASGATELPVKQSIPGPYTLGRLVDPGPLPRERLTIALADALAHELRSLVTAGVPMIQVEEDAASLMGEDAAEQGLFKLAHRRLTNTVRDAHLTLSLTGADISRIPPIVFWDAPYRSYLVDVVTTPANWAVVAGMPGERGIIAGAADAARDEPVDRDRLVWAALSAAALNGRGPDRVGLAPSGSLAGRSSAVARALIETLAEVAAETQTRVMASPELLDGPRLAAEGRERGYLPG